MEIQQIRYVCAVVEEGSFSRAAEHCHVAQPSLSQQILKLEGDLGARLFDRLGRKVRLTEAGRAFLPHARDILHQVDAARTSVADNRAEPRGDVAIGIIPTIAPYLMPGYAASFTKKYPEARLRLVEETTPVLAESLRNLSVDIAILSLPVRHKEFDLFPLLTEPLFAVLPRQHPRANARSIALKELRGEPFVMLRDGHCFRGLSIAVCARARVAPHIVFESDQLSSLLGMIAAGMGVTLVPEMAINRAADCSYVRLSDARAARTVAAAVLRGRSFNRAQQAFLFELKRKSRTKN